MGYFCSIKSTGSFYYIDFVPTWTCFIYPFSNHRFCLFYRLGAICFRANEITKAITCFEYSLHVRKLLYGKDGVHLKIVQSLVYLGSAWAEYGYYHRYRAMLLLISVHCGRTVATAYPYRKHRSDLLH